MSGARKSYAPRGRRPRLQRLGRGLRMTVLVTGGAGYIGGRMVVGLKEAGEKVVVVDNLSTGYTCAVPEGIELVVCDFPDADLVSRVIQERGVNAIAHF